MSLRIEEGIRVTEPCSSASHVISEDSDLYGPLKAPPVFLDRELRKSRNPMARKVFSNLFAAISQFSVSTPIFYSIVHFGVHFVTLDNNAGRSDLLGITEFSR